MQKNKNKNNVISSKSLENNYEWLTKQFCFLFLFLLKKLLCVHIASISLAANIHHLTKIHFCPRNSWFTAKLNKRNKIYIGNFFLPQWSSSTEIHYQYILKNLACSFPYISVGKGAKRVKKINHIAQRRIWYLKSYTNSRPSLIWNSLIKQIHALGEAVLSATETSKKLLSDGLMNYEYTKFITEISITNYTLNNIRVPSCAWTIRHVQISDNTPTCLHANIKH